MSAPPSQDPLAERVFSLEAQIREYARIAWPWTFGLNLEVGFIEDEEDNDETVPEVRNTLVVLEYWNMTEGPNGRENPKYLISGFGKSLVEGYESLLEEVMEQARWRKMWVEAGVNG